jgi:hypothetical protein
MTWTKIADDNEIKHVQIADDNEIKHVQLSSGSHSKPFPYF